MIETYDNESRVEWCEYIVYRVDNYTEDVFIHVNIYALFYYGL